MGCSYSEILLARKGEDHKPQAAAGMSGMNKLSQNLDTGVSLLCG